MTACFGHPVQVAGAVNYNGGPRREPAVPRVRITSSWGCLGAGYVRPSITRRTCRIRQASTWAKPMGSLDEAVPGC